MSNLSELLPAGAGAKSASFVASGTLGSGQTVALNSDGTVSAVAGLAEGAGSPSVFESATTNYTASAYDSFNNKVVIAYEDNANSSYGTAVVGTVSGTSISFGTPVVFASAATIYVAATFDSISNQVIVASRYAGIRGSAIVGAVSGTSISFGSRGDFNLANTGDIAVTFDSNENKVVVAYRDTANSNQGYSAVGTVSGTSISFGAEVLVETGYTAYTSLAYDSANNKVVVAYQDAGNSGYGTARVGAVSGTTISFGATAVFESANTTYISATFDSNSNKIVVAYTDGGNSSYGTAIVGTVTGSLISFGSPTVFSSVATYYAAAVFDTNSNQVVIAYRDNANIDTRAIVGTVSGTSISFGSPTVLSSGSYNTYISAAYNSDEGTVAVAYKDVGNSGYGTSVVYVPPGLTNSADFIGITDQAIADTATGAVIVQGGVSEKVSGLTTGSDYYVQDDGTLSTTVSSVPAGRALSTTSILLEG